MALFCLKYIAYFLYFTVSVSGHRPPLISYISPDQIRGIGAEVDLQCEVVHAKDYPILWVKYDSLERTTIPLAANDNDIITDPRYSLRFDAESTTYTLTIKGIQEADDGLYQCQLLTSGESKITADVVLHVRRTPVISSNYTSAPVAREGESAKLECYAEGYPTPRISWRRENNAILPNGETIYRGNVLKIPSVRKEDRGTYYCMAKNGVGRGALKTIELQVEFAPVVTVPRPELRQVLNCDIGFGCQVMGYPRPGITWFKGEEQLSNNEHYRLSNFATADDFTVATLRVFRVEKSDYGMFTCKAQNEFGTDNGQVELVETTILVGNPNCEKKSNESTTSSAP